MKKFLITALLVLFATAAYAEVTFDLSGSFHARGQYWSQESDNTGADAFAFGDPIPTGATSDTVTFSVYDGDLNLYPKITVDNTTLTMKLAIKDETWDDPGGDRPGGTDDNIKVERLYLTHYFDNGVTLDAGLMDGGAWGTLFADTVVQKYRVKVIHTKSPVGAIGALVEKNTESSSPYIKDSEKDDDDSYALFMVTKAGNIFIKPLIFYVHNSSNVPGVPALGLDYDEDGVNVLYLALELSGDLGNGLGFESELGWKQYDVEDLQALAPLNAAYANAKDADVYGAYLNVWKNLDAAKLGLILTYGSWDDKAGSTGTGFGWDYGDDFESNLILGDWVAWGSSSGNDLEAATMVKLYAADIKSPVDKLTFKGSFAYIMSNQEDNVYEDATAWEIDLGGAYAITDNLAYRFQAGYADISYDIVGYDDPDPVMLLEHRIALSF
jgi:hypothetical protein